jgi:type 1 fimbriae regulatory protein FimB/type 1 fimbriae regulatory protein FimE
MKQRAALKLVTDQTPIPLFGSTARRRPAKKHRKFLTEAEVAALAKAADNHRDRTMITTGYTHGLRVSELVGLTWAQIDLAAAIMRIYRHKHGRDATHPIPASELRALRRLQREQAGASEFVFLSRLGGPMTPRAFAQMLERTATAAGLPKPFNPHALRHACGYKLASDGRDMRTIQHYLGHRDLKSTEIYTEAAPTNFRGFFR